MFGFNWAPSFPPTIPYPFIQFKHWKKKANQKESLILLEKSSLMGQLDHHLNIIPVLSFFQKDSQCD